MIRGRLSANITRSRTGLKHWYEAPGRFGTARRCCTQGRHQRPQSTKGLRASFRPWVAICLRRLSRRLAKARSHRLHGPARQSLRQRQGRELHEDTQGQSRVSDGIRNLRGRYSRPSPLHRRGLQHPQTPLRARLSEPRAIRGSTRPATCQNRRLKLSTIKGALHKSATSCREQMQQPCLGKRQSYSITSSARASKVGGTSRPSAFAVLRLITSSYLVGACTGKSAGLSPLRMRST